jgi:two-component system, LuxR family, sensor kinase FixL
MECPIAHGIESVLSGGCSRFVQEYPCHAPGRQRWYALTAAPVNSEPAAAVLVHFDITERRLAAERARQARDAMAQAARVNAVGTLAVSLIHELTQPLSAAGFYSGTAVALLEQGTSDPEKLRSVLAGVDGQIKRTADILQRLRDFARQRERHVAEVEIDQVVAQALALVGWFAVDRHVNLKYARPAPGLTVRGDALQLEQVLVNLICNGVQAIDAADPPRREVSVGVQRRPGEIEVTVRDTGPGVPPEMQDRLFDIFATSKTSGLGMGLAISRDIVEAHDGKLWAEPNPGRGRGRGVSFHPALPAAGGSRVTETQTVFVVDDDPAVRDSIAVMLDQAGFRVLAFASPRDLPRRLFSARCGLPDSRSSDAGNDRPRAPRGAQRLGPGLPVIFLSGYGDVPATVRAIKGGAIDFLEKPVTPDTLVDRVRHALEEDNLQRAAQAEQRLVLERYARLSPRERQVMRLATQGLGNKEIARELGISHRTVENHRARVLEKMQAQNVADLCRMAGVCLVPDGDPVA